MNVSEKNKININSNNSSSQPRKRVIWRLLAVATLTLVGLAIIAVGIYLKPRPNPAYLFHGIMYDPPEPAPDFELTNQHGEPVRLTDFRGQLVFLYFGFTHCPDACPMTLAIWKKVHQELGTDTKDVHFVMITVDPERDTAQKLKKHLSLFHDDFIALRGSLEYTEEVAREYNVFMQHEELEGSAMNYVVNHTTLSFVIDQNGQRVLAYPLDATPQEIAADLRQLLKSK